MYFKEYSQNLGKEIEFNVYGVSGIPLLMFPTMDGRFYQYDDFGLIDSIAHLIHSNKVQVFTADGIDFESLTNHSMDPEHRLQRYEQYIAYITKELTPRIYEINRGSENPIVSGCSMGGYHTTNIFLRHPELFQGMISLSGVFCLKDMFGGYQSDLLYKNSPLDYLKDLTKKDKKYKEYLNSQITICCGQGAHEEKMLRDTAPLKQLFSEKEIPAFFDLWGYDVTHDWCWWKKQLPYFLEKMLKL